MSEDNKFREKLKEAAGLIPRQTPESLPKSESPRPCPKCNSETVRAEVGGTRLYPIDTTQRSFSTKSSSLRAIVCTFCGHTEFYALEPLNLVVKRPDRKIEDFRE